jgi:O-antigen/teichoic acid export membrane protein
MFLPYSNTIRLAVIAVALSKCLDGLSDVIYSRLQVSEVIAPIAKSQLAKAFLSIAILSLTLAVIPNQLVAIGATVGPYAMVLFFYDLPALRRYDTAAHPMLHMAWATTARQLGTIARLGLPLAVVSTMVVLHAAVPRLVFASQIGETGAGTVAALSYLAGAPNLLVVALAQSSVTRLVRSLATGDRKGYLTGVLRLVSVAIAIGGITLLIGLYFGGPILHLCYGPRFLGHERDLLIFLSAGAVSYLNTAVGYGLSSARVFGIQIPMMAIVCLISLVSSLLFVPRWGLAGAAASQMVSAIVQLLLSAILLARSVVTRFPLTPSSSNGQMMTMIHAKL